MSPPSACVRFVPAAAASAEGALRRKTAEVFLGDTPVPVGWVCRTCLGEAAPPSRRHRWSYCPADGGEPGLDSLVSEHHLCRQVAEYYLGAP